MRTIYGRHRLAHPHRQGRSAIIGGTHQRGCGDGVTGHGEVVGQAAQHRPYGIHDADTLHEAIRISTGVGRRPYAAQFVGTDASTGRLALYEDARRGGIAIVGERQRGGVGHRRAGDRQREGLIDAQLRGRRVADAQRLGVRGAIAAAVGGRPAAHQVEALQAGTGRGRLEKSDARHPAVVGGAHYGYRRDRRAAFEQGISGRIEEDRRLRIDPYQNNYGGIAAGTGGLAQPVAQGFGATGCVAARVAQPPVGGERSASVGGLIDQFQYVSSRRDVVGQYVDAHRIQRAVRP